VECAPDKPTDHEKDHEYDYQRENGIVAPALRAVCMSLKMSLQKMERRAEEKGRKPGAALSRWYVRIGSGCSTQIKNPRSFSFLKFLRLVVDTTRQRQALSGRRLYAER
jgi:hypothetical protein